MKRNVVLRAATAVVAALAVTATAIAVAKGTEQDATVVGYFADASPLDPGTEVRAAGVEVGSVDDISLENGLARVTLDVEPSILPLHKDARLRIRPVNVLGEQYVEVHPGSPSQPYMEEAVIPAKRTETAVSLQAVLNTFDDPTANGLAALITTLGEGMRDSGGEAAAAIKALAPAMQRSGELGAVLREQNTVLNQLVDRVNLVAKSLASKNGKSLDRLVGSAERMLTTLATRHEALDSTLSELPATLTEARRTLAELAGVSDAATPTLRSVRPVTDNLSAITAELQRFADAADPALASLHPVLNRADELLKQAAPVAERLRLAGPDLETSAKKLRPLGDELLDDHLGDLMAFVKKWSLSTNGRDALSHYFRGVVHVTPATLRDMTSTLPPESGDDLGGGADGPVDPGKLLPNSLPGLLADGKGESETDPGNATGLTPKQENSLLGQLLGG